MLHRRSESHGRIFDCKSGGCEFRRLFGPCAVIRRGFVTRGVSLERFGGGTADRAARRQGVGGLHWFSVHPLEIKTNHPIRRILSAAPTAAASGRSDAERRGRATHHQLLQRPPLRKVRPQGMPLPKGDAERGMPTPRGSDAHCNASSRVRPFSRRGACSIFPNNTTL